MRRPDPTFEPTAAICTGCGQPCMTTQVDVGLGEVDVWGFRVNHQDHQIRSDCCEAAVTDAGD